MSHLKTKKLFTITLLYCVTHAVAASAGNDKNTLYNTSIKWEDEAHKAALLDTVPAWQNDTIGLQFNIYRNPNLYQIPDLKDARQYNIQYINAFWGPLDNPFDKYPRPAKAFVFVGNKTPLQFYMAPVIKNLSDANYYVFDKTQPHPVLLNDWVSTIQTMRAAGQPVRFNICTGYGDMPADSCDDKGYQDEVADIYKKPKTDATIMLSPEQRIPSARRKINEDWRTSLRRPFSSMADDYGNIMTESVDWKDQNARKKMLENVPTWANYKVIQANFEKIRDPRYFREPKRHDFMRRISWLYPDDGCWTRATAAIKDFFGPFQNSVNEYVRPAKVFVFGNLCANTPNDPSGRVLWGYHTAPVIRDAATNQTYVLDPSVEPYHPMPIEKWMDAVSAHSGACAGLDSSVASFNICNGYGVGPYDKCNYSTYDYEERALLEQKEFQQLERLRQEELGRDADKVLGDQPPWVAGE